MRKLVGIIGLVLSLSSAVHAQEFPSKPITIVVPFGAGGTVDQVARGIAMVMSEKLGQPVVVENKTGAGGIVATEYVAHSKPDGYTLLFGTNAALISAPLLQKKLSYNPRTDFSPIHGILSTSLIMTVNAVAPYKSLAELVDHARKNPGKLNFSSIGPGSLQQLAPELFMKEAGITMTHVPYKLTTMAITDLMGGTIDVITDGMTSLGPQITAGKLRALAVTGSNRMRTLPDVGTFAEMGYPGVTSKAFAVAVAPKNTPVPIMDRLSKVIGDSLRDPSVAKIILEQGSEIMSDVDRAKLAEFLEAEATTTQDIIQRAGIKPE